MEKTLSSQSTIRNTHNDKRHYHSKRIPLYSGCYECLFDYILHQNSCYYKLTAKVLETAQKRTITYALSLILFDAAHATDKKVIKKLYQTYASQK